MTNPMSLLESKVSAAQYLINSSEGYRRASRRIEVQAAAVWEHRSLPALFHALARTMFSAGNISPIKIPITVIETRSSTSVNP